MLSDRNNAGVRAKLREELGENPGLARVVAAFQSASEGFEIVAESAGLELVPLESGPGALSRCRVKFFKPRAEKERLCAFFFKKSNLPWSRDRFSYGGVEFLPDDLAESDIRTWVSWLVSGFDPERRPERLRRAFLYDIPD